MNRYSTRQAATKLGISHNTLARHIASGKLPSPEAVIPGIRPTHIWTEAEIEQLRKLLPKIANGRKTRYKKQSALSTQQSAKTKAQARVPVPHKKRKSKRSNPQQTAKS